MSFSGDKHNIEHDGAGTYLHTSENYNAKPFVPSPTAQQLAHIYTPAPDDPHFWTFSQRSGAAQVVPSGVADQPHDNWPLEHLEMLQHDIARDSRPKRRRVDPRDIGLHTSLAGPSLTGAEITSGADLLKNVGQQALGYPVSPVSSAANFSPHRVHRPQYHQIRRMHQDMSPMGKYTTSPTAGCHIPGQQASLCQPPAVRYKEVTNVLTILEQPTEHGRFRYKKEKRRTPLNGRKEGTFPAVGLQGEWQHKVRDGTVIYASVVTRQNDSRGIPMPHWHGLEGKTGESATQRVVQGKATFSNLVVVRNERNAHRCAEDHQVIRIMFQVKFDDPETGEHYYSFVVSEPIYGTELKIHNVSHRIIATERETEVIFLTSKIKKQNIALKLTDSAPNADWRPPTNQKDDGAGWHLDEQQKVAFLLQPLYVHHQYALVAKLPPHFFPRSKVCRKVDIKLVDHVQGMESNSVELEYKPEEDLVSSAVPEAMSTGSKRDA
eukprot:m.262780 g.262780  ORF g.262780 m.262780 type:complete len:492 (+) comp19698_c0_seq3:891-2366(+)